MRHVSPEEAASLLEGGEVRPLDVRTPDEYVQLGHLRGASLLPVNLIAVAPATIPREGKPILVYCEHGVRSAHAARLLDQAGFPDVINMTGGMSRWTGERDHTPADPFHPIGPSSWVVESARHMKTGGRVLDVASGNGRHALLLASAGFSVEAVDVDEEAIRALQADACRLGFSVTARVVDLESDTVDLVRGRWDTIVVIRYLHRPLFPTLIDALRPDGILVYETFTIHQAERGRPTNPDYLLQPGELPRLVEPLEILDSREGEFDQRMVSGVIARKPRDMAGG